MEQLIDHPIPRIPVGTHYRVWWFWLPLILGVIGMLTALALLPVARGFSAVIGLAAIVCFIWSAVSSVVIVRGRRWLEVDRHRIRVSDRTGVTEFAEHDVTDLTIIRAQQHAGGRLVAESRDLILGIDADSGQRTVKLTNRLPVFSADPLDELIERLCEQLRSRAVNQLAMHQTVEGESWRLNRENLTVQLSRQEVTLPVPSISAVETIGQEVRIWTEGNPRAVVRLSLATRNTWLLPRLLVRDPEVVNLARKPGEKPPVQYHLGRILFERTSGPVASLLFLMIGLLLAMLSIMTLFIAVRAMEPVGIVLGVMLGIISTGCLIGAFRVRRIRFCCHEHGIERVTITARQELPYSSIDVFSFESRRNHSQGRYTGTTYTLVFADRSREQGRGIFFSTTVRNTDDELELLRERVAGVIARRMAKTYARSRRVQWTPDLWFGDDMLELSRPRRLLVGPKLAIIPYDTITHFEVRDGLFHIWTNYQERAVITVKTSSANFYPGLILLESLVNAHVQETVDEWTPTTPQTS
ncbi:MAG: hypothetical protein R3C02_20605 [Planctomycetaceae bacterium]